MGCGSSTEASDPSKQNGHANGAERPRSQWRKDNEPVEQIELTEGVIQQYIDLEKEIHRLEMKNVVKKYDAKMIHADELKKTVDQLEATYKELKKQTEKEKADVDNIEQPSVRAFLKQQGTWDQKFNKEQQEYLDALNRQEVAEKELKGAKMAYERATKIAEIYKKRADKQNELYDKQDHLLAGIFGGQYGSDMENKLEAQLDDALEWMQRVSLAKFKWTNARVLLVHACTQLAFGIKRWQELEQIELSNTRMRYFAAAEARNNFIAAGQNVQSARVYLGKVQFPYCTPEEMAALETAVNNAFTDIQTVDKYKKAHEVYDYTHRKAAALIQWFDQVISETILKDMEQATGEVTAIQKELRQERLKLIKEKVKEKFGRELEIQYDDITDDDENEQELLALEAETVKDGDDLPGEQLTGLLSMTNPDGRAPTPLPKNQLAAAPSNEAIFGMITNHEKDVKALQQRQTVAESKMKQGLQEKLDQRRSRRDRQKSTAALEEPAVKPK